MALLRLQVDLAIPEEVAKKPAVKSKLKDLYGLLKQAKALSVRINEGKDNEEMTVKAIYHTCYHDDPDNPKARPCSETLVEI